MYRLWIHHVCVISSHSTLLSRMDINDLIQIFPPSLAKFCPHLERLEFRWDNDTLRCIDWTRADVCSNTSSMDLYSLSRFSDKNQKAIDLLRTKCLKLKCMVSFEFKTTHLTNPYFPEFVRWKALRDHARKLWTSRPNECHPNHSQ